jgi:tRNA A37 threonylcarbamoyladenosine dehydratase
MALLKKSSLPAKRMNIAWHSPYERDRVTMMTVRMSSELTESKLMPSDLILEQLARNRVFLGDEGLEKLRSSFVIVVGCGGVGSHCTAALARSGVSKIRLIDFDQVTLSSLNRHALATLSDVGTPKVHCIRKRLEQVTPWTHFDCRNELFGESTADRQLSPLDGQAPDFVIDAIDNIDSKVALLHYCHSHKIPVISSMGAGCKSDPTRILIGDISASTDDPLSKATRRRLRALGVKDGIPVVFSSEKSGPGKAQLLPLPEEEFKKGNVGELGVLADFRVRILPVLGTMPAIFGLAVANHVILEITSYPHEYLPSKARDKMYDGILGSLQGLEEKLARYRGEDATGLRVPITQDDVGYLVEEVYRGRSVVSGLSTRLCLTRWNKPEEGFVDKRTPGQKNSLLQMKDLVCMSKEEAAKHEKEILKGDKKLEELYDAKVLKTVDERMREEEIFERFR